LRVRGDLGKLLTFTKLYAMLNLKRLEKVNEEIYTLTPEVAIEALKLALQPIAGMLARLDDRTKVLFSALKEGQENEADSAVNFDKKGTEITKRVRDQIAVKIGKSEKTVRSFLAQLTASGYVSDDGKKPKTFTLLYDVDELEKKTAGLLEKTKSADVLMEEMRKEAQEWVKTRLEIFSLADGQIKSSIVVGNEGACDNILEPSTGKKISNTVLANSQADSAKQGLDNRQNDIYPIKQGDIKKEPVFCFERIKPSDKCDCGKLAKEYRITIPSGDVIERCSQCYVELKREFAAAEWIEVRGAN
jgi:hypothetical protein